MPNRIAGILFPLAILLCLLSFTLGVKADEIDVIPDQITVVYSSADHELEIDDRVANVENVSDTVEVLHLYNSQDAQDVIESVRRQAGVLAVDHEAEAEMASVPNDPYYSSQSYLKQIGFENARAGRYTAKVAVLDTGIDYNHEDLRGRVELSGYNYVSNTTNISDSNGHGTAVSGIIAAQANNRIGIAGAAGSASVKVVPFTVLDSQGKGTLSDIVAALQTIATRSDIKVVNMSLAFDTSNRVMESVCNQVRDSGKILVSSVGNTGAATVAYPAALESVIGVGSCNANNRRCDQSDWGSGNGSSYGNGIDVLAPGTSIMTTCSSQSSPQKYKAFTGTSFSVSIVSAACALAATHDPNVDTASIRKTLAGTCLDAYSRGWDIYSGYGVLRMDTLANYYYQPVLPNDNHAINTTGIRLDRTNLSLMPGSSAYITVTSGNAAVDWSSSNSSVASVAGGRISANAPGTATITASVPGTGSSVSCTVTVLGYIGYEAHVENVGWMSQVSDGSTAGTTGRNLALEALRISPTGTNLKVVGRAHVENIGWQEQRSSGQIIGTTGRGLQMEALELNLSGSQAGSYDIFYRGHVENYGWTAWAKNGVPMGTQGKALQLEAVQIKILPKGSDMSDSRGDVAWTFNE